LKERETKRERDREERRKREIETKGKRERLKEIEIGGGVKITSLQYFYL
jgi:hypothetical protein